MAPCQKIFDHCFFSLITLSTEPQIIRQKISLNMFSVHKKGGKLENLVTLSFEPTGTCMTPGSLQHLQSATAWIFMWKICLKVYSPRSKHSYMNSIDLFVNTVYSVYRTLYVCATKSQPSTRNVDKLQCTPARIPVALLENLRKNDTNEN